MLKALTADLSPHGVAVITTEPLTVGSVITFLGSGYEFQARARVQNSLRDRASGGFQSDLKFLGKTNPLVIWSGENGRRAVTGATRSATRGESNGSRRGTRRKRRSAAV